MVRFVAAVAAVLAIAALPSAGRAVQPDAAPQASVLAYDGTRHTTLKASGVAVLQTTTFWGGQFTASTGESVRIFISDAYPEDPATGQRWANYLAGLIHGSELGSVTTYLVPFSDVDDTCGRGALACYSPAEQTIVALAERAPDGTSPEAILAHEYGHHVARNRLNTPWEAVEWGTKRWASYVNVCARTEQGTLFPGDEDRFYELNPGEGFAEVYRVLNERRAGRPETGWEVVDRSMYPDDQALRLVEQDVREPWTQNSTTARTGRFPSGRLRARSFSVATPLDGSLAVRLSGPPELRARIVVTSGGGAEVLARGRAGARRVASTVCGERSIRIRVERIRGAGRFRLAVSRP